MTSMPGSRHSVRVISEMLNRAAFATSSDASSSAVSIMSLAAPHSRRIPVVRRRAMRANALRDADPCVTASHFPRAARPASPAGEAAGLPVFGICRPCLAW